MSENQVVLENNKDEKEGLTVKCYYFKDIVS
jgi:hypothetical protein